MVTLVEKHIVSKQDKRFKNLDELSWFSKNLYNSCLYRVKQEYLNSGKTIRYNELNKLFCSENQPDYRSLPAATSQQLMMIFDKNIKSFFELIKMWKKNNSSLSGRPRFPRYKDKANGRNVVVFTSQQLFGKNGFITFPKQCKIPPLKTNISRENIRQVRIVHGKEQYIIEVVYQKQEKELIVNDNKASIDMGLNNLVCLSFNNTTKSYIISGKPLKSINQYHDKKKAEIQSELMIKQKKHTSKKLVSLTNKKTRKINDYTHKTSKKIVDKLVENNISELVIGYNPEWKQRINLGSKNNQTFCAIPHRELIAQLEYKCQLQGIKLIIREESYTSKCSALDLEPVKKHNEYVGIRVKRGLFKTEKGTLINADLNGSLNIGRKEFGDCYVSNFIANIGQGHCPIKLFV